MKKWRISLLRTVDAEINDMNGRVYCKHDSKKLQGPLFLEFNIHIIRLENKLI